MRGTNSSFIAFQHNHTLGSKKWGQCMFEKGSIFDYRGILMHEMGVNARYMLQEIQLDIQLTSLKGVEYFISTI